MTVRRLSLLRLEDRTPQWRTCHCKMARFAPPLYAAHPYIWMVRSLRAFVMTETELSDIAAAAITGDSKSPKNG